MTARGLFARLVDWCIPDAALRLYPLVTADRKGFHRIMPDGSTVPLHD